MKHLVSLLGFVTLHRAASFHFFNSDPSSSETYNEFVIPESRLEALLREPPTFISSSKGAALSAKSIDIVSLGSLTRLDYLTGQASTWARHVNVRHFWGFSEVQDYDTECSSISEEERKKSVARCKDLSFRVPRDGDYVGDDEERMKAFFREYYGFSEGRVLRSHDAGWICAQRRVGRAFGWLHSQYSSSSNEVKVPDYLVIVDDDTYVDLVHVLEYLENQERIRAGRALASAGCVFRQNEIVPFPLSYGGFGTILNKAALQRLSEPIYCSNSNGNITYHQKAICERIAKNQVGEASLFKDGMSVLQLFYVHSALKDFCMHSDWVLSYVLEFYLPHSSDIDHTYAKFHPHNNLIGILNYPSCGNRTITTGNTRSCTLFSSSCHNLAPIDMEAWALLSYAASRESYLDLPKLDSTDWDVAMEKVMTVEQVESKKRVVLPNLFLIGTHEAGSKEVADWLSSNNVCSPKPIKYDAGYKDKQVHFFDDISRYSRGVGFYSKFFEHCKDDNTVILDTTPEPLMHAERVFDMYQRVDPDLLKNLKSIIVLGEPSTKEFSQILNNTKSSLMSLNDGPMPLINTLGHNAWKHVTHLKTWANFFNRQQLLVLSYNELLQYPMRTQWRVEQFLDKNFQVELKSIHAEEEYPPFCLRDVLEPYYSKAHEELYQFIDSAGGPWMQQQPFPQYTVPTCFTYASVLGWNPDEIQNKMYLDAMRVLIRSLQGSIADFIVMMMYHDEEAETLLRSDGATIMHINPLHHSLNVTYFEPWFVDIALAKLRAYELTKYSRVQVLDVDTSVQDVENMDKLFTSFPDTKLVAEGLGSDTPLRAGWFMLNPSKKDFGSIQALLGRGIFTHDHGWDNLDLPLQYPGWKSIHPSGSWEFYGSQLEQGLLFHHFYSMPKNAKPTLKDNELLTLLDDDDLLKYGFVHFYGERKPWVNNVNTKSLPLHVLSARDLWLKRRKELENADVSKATTPYHTLPLTRNGFKQYARALVLYPYYSFAPTLSPSKSPSSSPSKRPTISPSTSPNAITISPTKSPTTPPTLSPTKSPMKKPSTSPTKSPTKIPVTPTPTSPTKSPSKQPSYLPGTPSKNPSSSPTLSPTTSKVSPTRSPTTSPMKIPPTSPTKSPTKIPSTPTPTSPTKSPSKQPTHPPGTPSKKPTTGPTLSPAFPMVSPTRSPTKSPTKSPSASQPAPSTIPPTEFATRTTIDIKATFTWNLTCLGLNRTGLLANAIIIEQSIFEGIKRDLSNEELVHVLVLRLCNDTVESHLPFNGTARRLLEANLSSVDFTMRVTQGCDNCEVQMFNSTTAALNGIINNGTLQNDIDKNSNGTMVAFINADSLLSNFTLVSNSPTSSPTFSPSTSPSTSPTKRPTKIPSTPPSTSPAKSPTKQPTHAPGSPSRNPSTSPTKSPTKIPSTPPSTSPTKSPTKHPTQPPTNIPTHIPTSLRPIQQTTSRPTKGSKTQKSEKPTPLSSPITPRPTVSKSNKMPKSAKSPPNSPSPTTQRPTAVEPIPLQRHLLCPLLQGHLHPHRARRTRLKILAMTQNLAKGFKTSKLRFELWFLVTNAQTRHDLQA